MVKGVNKTVIEINDTGSNMFDKVLLFVSPDYGNLGTARLKHEAENIIKRLDNDAIARQGVRERFKKRKRIKYICLTALAVLVAVGCIMIF